MTDGFVAVAKDPGAKWTDYEVGKKVGGNGVTLAVATLNVSQEDLDGLFSGKKVNDVNAPVSLEDMVWV